MNKRNTISLNNFVNPNLRVTAMKKLKVSSIKEGWLVISVLIVLVVGIGGYIAYQKSSQQLGTGSTQIYGIIFLSDSKTGKLVETQSSFDYDSVVRQITNIIPKSIVKIGTNTLYDTNNPSASLDLGYEYHVKPVVAAGSPSVVSWGTTGKVTLRVNGVQKLQKEFSQSNNGMPPSDITLSSIMRSGKDLSTDFGPASVDITTQKVDFDIEGTMTVTFSEGKAATVTFAKQSLGSVPLTFEPAQGSFTVNLDGSSSQFTSGSQYSFGSGGTTTTTTTTTATTTVSGTGSATYVFDKSAATARAESRNYNTADFTFIEVYAPNYYGKYVTFKLLSGQEAAWAVVEYGGYVYIPIWGGLIGESGSVIITSTSYNAGTKVAEKPLTTSTSLKGVQYGIYIP